MKTEKLAKFINVGQKIPGMESFFKWQNNAVAHPCSSGLRCQNNDGENEAEFAPN